MPSLPPAVTRSVNRNPYRPGDTLAVTIDVRDVTSRTTVADTFPALMPIAAPGSGTVEGNTMRFTIDADTSVSYSLSAPVEGACQEEGSTFSGTVEPSRQECRVSISGTSAIRCEGICPPPPDAAPATLEPAFIFGSRDLEAPYGPVPLFNGPAETYTIVQRIDGDPLPVAYPDPQIELGPSLLYPGEQDAVIERILRSRGEWDPPWKRYLPPKRPTEAA